MDNDLAEPTVAMELPPPPLPAKPKLRDVIRSFNGFEEQAVERAFGTQVEDLSSTFLGRAALFVLKRRESGDDTDSYRAAMMASLSDIDDMFAASDDGEGDSPEA